MAIFEGMVLYKRRWIFVLGLFVMQFFSGISFTSYGQISSFYVQFFGATHAQVDWITNARNISALLITFPLAWLIFKGKAGLRVIILITAGSSTIGLLFVTLSFIDRSLFALIVTGQILCGVSETVGVAVPSTYAVLWFPESQIGTAIAMIILGINLGDLTGYILPAFLVPSSNETWMQEKQLSTDELKSGQRSLLYMYGAFLVISAAVTVLFAIFFTDKPPTPPTFAQDLKEHDLKTGDKSRNFKELTKRLFTNASYVFICIDIGIVFQIVLLENMMMAEIIQGANFGLDIAPQRLSGLMVSMYSFGGIPGLLISGKVVDHYKKYKLLGIIGNIAIFLSTAAIAISVLYENRPGIFVGLALFGFSVSFTVVALFEMVTQLTYPIDETLANTWMTGIQTAIGLLIGVFGRIIYNSYKSLGLVLFQCACAFMGVVICCLVSSKNRRLEVEQAVDTDNEQSIRTPLIASE